MTIKALNHFFLQKMIKRFMRLEEMEDFAFDECQIQE